MDFNNSNPEKEGIAESLIGKNILMENRDVEVFGSYGIGDEVFFLLKWKDTGMFFSQDFYTVVALIDVGLG